MNLKYRVIQLEKENAELKRQLEERLTHRQVVETIAQFLQASANSAFNPECRGNKDASHKITT